MVEFWWISTSTEWRTSFHWRTRSLGRAAIGVKSGGQRQMSLTSLPRNSRWINDIFQFLHSTDLPLSSAENKQGKAYILKVVFGLTTLRKENPRFSRGKDQGKKFLAGELLCMWDSEASFLCYCNSLLNKDDLTYTFPRFSLSLEAYW